MFHEGTQEGDLSKAYTYAVRHFAMRAYIQQHVSPPPPPMLFRLQRSPKAFRATLLYEIRCYNASVPYTSRPEARLFIYARVIHAMFILWEVIWLREEEYKRG